MKIGYMGIPGSFSEVAAREMVEIFEFKGIHVEFIPMVCASNILAGLRDGSISQGVLAIENSTAGPVDEFVETFKNVRYDYLGEHVLFIRHYLYKKSPEVSVEQLTKVASHPQALAQTKLTRAKNWPHMQDQEIEDTAIGAEWLAKGILPETTAVICSQAAGEAWGLDLIAPCIQDFNDNRTTFWMIQLPIDEWKMDWD